MQCLQVSREGVCQINAKINHIAQHIHIRVYIYICLNFVICYVLYVPTKPLRHLAQNMTSTSVGINIQSDVKPG